MDYNIGSPDGNNKWLLHDYAEGKIFEVVVVHATGNQIFYGNMIEEDGGFINMVDLDDNTIEVGARHVAWFREIQILTMIWIKNNVELDPITYKLNPGDTYTIHEGFMGLNKMRKIHG